MGKGGDISTSIIVSAIKQSLKKRERVDKGLNAYLMCSVGSLPLDLVPQIYKIYFIQ